MFLYFNSSRFLLITLGINAFFSSVSFGVDIKDRPQGCEFPTGTFPTTYTKCTVTPSYGFGTDAVPYCLDAATTTLPPAFTVYRAPTGTNSALIVDIPVKNCRTKLEKVQGDFALVVDNSGSTCITATNDGSDCAKKRLNLAKTLINKLYVNRAADNLVNIGVTAYGGIYSVELATATGLNQDYKKLPCEDNSVAISPNPWTGAARANEPWTTLIGDIYQSYCESLKLASFTENSNFNTFIDFIGSYPRGATDLTYFLEGGGKVLSTGSQINKNVITITDGLPNMPIHRPKDECETRPRIKPADGKYALDNAQREYCIDRRYKHAENEAHTYAEGLNGFSAEVPTLFSTKNINVYHTLYVAEGKSFFDYDSDTDEKLNPLHFLAENSARTGNGKEKIIYLRGETLAAREEAYLSELLQNFDAHAIHHVEIKVTTPSGVAKTAYNAVSHSKFGNDSYSDVFRLKLAGLEAGINTVLVNVYYNDSPANTPTPITMMVTVTEDPALITPETKKCESMNSTLTVDGDDPNDTKPLGDGVLPYVNSDASKPTQCRVYRNFDLENSIPDGEFTDASVVARQDTSLRVKADKLKIQGGTGNCGTIAASTKGSTTFYWITLLIPLVGSMLLRRRRS